MTLARTVRQALQSLQSAGLPRLEAQLLVLHALARASDDRAWLLTHEDQPLEAAQQDHLLALADRRQAGEPMAYLLGRKNFHAIELCIDPRVLDPRHDTETLVDWALRVAPAESPIEVLDLGTGSGAIALALAHARPRWLITASDVSEDALSLARWNGSRLGLPVTWVLGDWLNPLRGRRFDLMVSNPPYIAASDPHLPALRHEPYSALVSGADGLDAIRAIVTGAHAHLRSQGWLLIEHGHDQASAVRELLRQAGFSDIQSERDLAGIERCSAGRWLAANFSSP